MRLFRQGLRLFRQGMRPFRQGVRLFRQGMRLFSQGMRLFRQGSKRTTRALGLPQAAPVSLHAKNGDVSNTYLPVIECANLS